MVGVRTKRRFGPSVARWFTAGVRQRPEPRPRALRHTEECGDQADAGRSGLVHLSLLGAWRETGGVLVVENRPSERMVGCHGRHREDGATDPQRVRSTRELHVAGWQVRGLARIAPGHQPGHRGAGHFDREGHPVCRHESDRALPGILARRQVDGLRLERIGAKRGLPPIVSGWPEDRADFERWRGVPGVGTGRARALLLGHCVEDADEGGYRSGREPVGRCTVAAVPVQRRQHSDDPELRHFARRHTLSHQGGAARDVSRGRHGTEPGP